MKRWGGYLTRDPYFTKSMKRIYLGARFPFEYDFVCDSVPPDREYRGRDVLFVLHELSLTGAPRAAYTAALVVLESGGFPVVLSAKDGAMKKEFTESGIPVVVNTGLFYGYFTASFARNFDLVVATTLVCTPLIEHLDGANIMWWVHEGKLGLEHAKGYPKFRSILRSAKNIYVCSHYCTQFIREVDPTYTEKLLIYGIPDEKDLPARVERKDIIFTLAGSIEPRKGQNFFISAIKKMSPDIRKKALFQIVGSPPANTEYYDNYLRELKGQAKDIKEICFLGQMPNQKILELFSMSDVIVSASIDDPMPLVITKAMMQSKTCICSSMTGSASLIDDGKNAFVFVSEDANALSEKMSFIIKHPDCMNRIGDTARRLYERNFSMDVFKSNFLRIMDDLVEGDLRRDR